MAARSVQWPSGIKFHLAAPSVADQTRHPKKAADEARRPFRMFQPMSMAREMRAMQSLEAGRVIPLLLALAS